MAFLQNFREFQVFIYGYRAQNKTPEITENLYFQIYNGKTHAQLFLGPLF